MRFIWLLFISLASGMAALLPRHHSAGPTAVLIAPPVAPTRVAAHLPHPTQADSVVAFALRQLGAPYLYAGTNPATGFDCSGFVQYVFGHFAVPVPHATSLLIEAGRAVPRADARPGDLVVFAGTAPGSTTPGHAGIVVSARGTTPLRFVHASSARREPGVKISSVEGTGYETRFMQIRRVL